MARVVMSAIIETISGKLGSAVFTKGRSGLNVRTRVKPHNPQTSYQTLVRNYFAVYTKMWRTLTPTEIASWNSAGANTAVKNKFGQSYAKTGKGLFIAANTENALVGDGVTITTPPASAIPTLIPITGVSFDSVTPAATVKTDAAVPADSLLQVWATPQLSAGISNFGKRATLIKTFPAGTAAGSLDIYPEYSAKYGLLIPGQQVAVQCYLNNANAPKFFAKHKTGAELAGKVI